MRRPSARLIITFLVGIVVGYGVAWGIMLYLQVSYFNYDFGIISMIAILVSCLLVFILDTPLDLKTFEWPAEETEDDDKLRHIIYVFGLTGLVTLISLLILQQSNILPPLASEEGTFVDQLFGLHLQVIAFLFALIMVFMIYSVVVFKRKPGETDEGDHIHGNATLEIIWTVLPLAVVLYFSYIGAQYLNEITEPDPEEMVIDVIGTQFSWRFDYPEYDISSTELNLPRDRQVLLQLTSLDVIHSFWVPEFRLKQDAVPGMTTELRVTPTQLGEYTLRCAELCGLNHAYMLAPVNVMLPTDFEAWVAAETAPAEADTPVARGANLAQLHGCAGCHTADGNPSVGPTWLGVFGSEEALEDGSSVVVDEDYLRDSIIDPNAQIVSGFAPNLMPAIYEDVLSPEDIDDLISYIESLSN